MTRHARSCSLSSLLLLAIASSLFGVGCKEPKEGSDTGETAGDSAEDTEDTDHDQRVSNFTSGQYRVSAIRIVDDESTGFDIDGDGDVDNKFPSVLLLVDLALDDDFSPEGFNATLATAVADETLILLVEASQAQDTFVLSYDLLLGQIDPKTEVVSVDDDASYEMGVAEGHMEGWFRDETSYETGPDDIEVPISFFPGEPALMVPISMALSAGMLDDASNVSMIGGAIPVNALVEQVIEPMIPAGGYGGQTKEEILKSIYSLATNPYISDIELEDGSRAFSAALAIEASATIF